MKGQPGPAGEAGPAGVTPNINATASVDNTTDNPTVNVSKDIIDDTTTFNFAFSGLKGQPGPAGEAGPAGPSNVESYESTGRAIANINGTDIKIPNIYPSYIISATAESILTLNSGISFQPGSNTLMCQAIDVSNVAAVEGSKRGIKHINTAFIIYPDNIAESNNIVKLATISNKLFERFDVVGDLRQYCNVYYYTDGNYTPINMNSYNISPRISIKVETNASGETENNIYLELEDRADFYGIKDANGLFVIVDITYM